MLGDISHEIRSPLARQGVALGLARRKAGPDAGSALDRIERESERLNEMIGQLLTLTRLESGTHGLDNVQIDLRVLLHGVADDADFEARDRNRSVQVVKDEPTTINGVPGMIHSAIVRTGIAEAGFHQDAQKPGRFAALNIITIRSFRCAETRRLFRSTIEGISFD